MSKLTKSKLKRIIYEEMNNLIDEDWIGDRNRFTPPLGSELGHLEDPDENDFEDEDDYMDDLSMIRLNEGGCGCGPAPEPKNYALNDYSLNTMGDHMPDEEHVVGISFETPNKSHHKESSYMARKHLLNLAVQTVRIAKMLPNDLDDWMRSNIATAADDIYEVYSSLVSDTFEDVI